jgi:hypothetical protein
LRRLRYRRYFDSAVGPGSIPAVQGAPQHVDPHKKMALGDQLHLVRFIANVVRAAQSTFLAAEQVRLGT